MSSQSHASDHQFSRFEEDSHLRSVISLNQGDENDVDIIFDNNTNSGR